jgi:hypothetical protein
MTAAFLGHQSLWATPIGIYRLDGADDCNIVLARALSAMRIAQGSASDQAFFASSDDLLDRLGLPEGRRVVQFIVESLKDTVGRANAVAWKSVQPARSLDMRIAIEGMWFQCANRGAFHDVHSHGNCSWSGVYIVQIDPAQTRCEHPVYGTSNGLTRFFGPYFNRLGGAHVDLGNAYLQPPHVDVEPVAGQVVVFPSWLAHQAMPYEGRLDRIIISFNASIHAQSGGDRLHAFGAR